METLDKMAREGDGKTVMISCEMDLGIDWLLETIWQVSSGGSGQTELM
jgi:ribosome-interacting GTPase 1